jgi:DNA-binding PadR family transcriptional regulator
MMAKSPGPLEAELLELLMRTPSGSYGAEMARTYEAAHGRTISLGALYTVLERLEKKGWVGSAWGEGTAERGGRRKRIYTVKAEGRLAMANRVPAPAAFGTTGLASHA